MQKIVMLLVMAQLIPGLGIADTPNIEMVFVKGGCFQMGDTFGEGGDDEKPVHEVCVDDFYIGKYEVTRSQWQAVTGRQSPSYFLMSDNLPVEFVSWNAVQSFLKKLNKVTGQQYRLPTEAEWEYAARSGGKNTLFAGTTDMARLIDYAWFRSNSRGQTHPVGLLEPNGLGLYDMSGNVAEWCMDYYDEDYYRVSPKHNPRGPTSGRKHVIRGGGWNHLPSNVRATSRNIFPRHRAPTFRDADLGFRMVLPAVR